MEKIIFLDFDGVLNSTESLVLNNDNRLFYGRRSLVSYEARVKTNLSYLDFDKLILLRDLCNQTGAKIVVISSYIRLKIYSLIEKSLIDFGLPIFGTVSKYESRGFAIKKFLRNHPCDKFVILDDEVFEDYDDELLPFLIKTDYYNGGLQYHHTKEILDYFKDVHVEKFLLMQQTKSFN